MGGGSSSKSSRKHPRNNVFDEKVITYDSHAITSGFGYDMLSRHGWVEGESLGARGRGSEEAKMTKPIPIVVRTTRAGIGSAAASSTSSASSFEDDQDNTTDAATLNSKNDYDNDHSLVFDPLRPRCRYNPNHICASLKALQKHERNCPANRGRHHEEGEMPSHLLIDEPF